MSAILTYFTVKKQCFYLRHDVSQSEKHYYSLAKMAPKALLHLAFREQYDTNAGHIFISNETVLLLANGSNCRNSALASARVANAANPLDASLYPR
jgi:hypothetical protein